MLYPYSKDGSTINESCRYKDGYFRIGPKNNEVKVWSLTEALERLEKLPVARWRRPSATSGKMGIVTATRWA